MAAYEASAGEVEDYIDKLRTHYQDTLSVKTYSLKYHFLNRRYQDQNYWDYQTPNLYMSQRVVEVDLEKRQFYDNDIVYFAGGRLYDRAQFQSDTESYFYERSATVLGRAVEQREMNNFDIFKSYNIMNIDFLAVRPLLEESNIEGKITVTRDAVSGTTTFKHKTSENQVIDYTFRDASLKLIEINHRPLGGVYVYKDYQTTRDLTYARSVYQYYDGATKPTYISFIDHFSVIDQVDPEKLKIPEGYGPVVPRGNGILEAEKIADDLYLVTDSSEVTNSLLKINGDEITLFGAATSRTIGEKILAFTAQRFPDKTIGSVYVTHPHGLQIFGLDVFANQGIKVLADEYTIEAIKAYEPFASTINNFKFRTITHEQIIDDAHFYVLENLHSKRQGFVHFKDSGIIFQSSFMHVPKDNTIAKVIPSYTRTFMNFVKDRKLEAKRIVANYRNNNITPEVIKKILDVNF
jgi:hypothetical protein